ncbi:MAG: biotin/lipoyl-binding protein [Dehalococcoidales bacterium]|nr:biotin/lipoyl-binding protein [Dehalococcoidales bacterium]
MKVLKIVLGLLLCGTITLGASCAAKSDSTEELPTQTVAVRRGDLSIDITGSGNLALSHTEDLAFNIPAAFTTSSTKSLTVQEVLVAEGDSVKEGQVLARLDISAWQDQLITLETALATAQRNQTQAEINMINAETTLEDTEKQYTTSDAVAAAGTSVSSAWRSLEYAKAKLDLVVLPSEIAYWTDEVNAAQQRLTVAQVKLEEARAGKDPKEVTLARLQYEMMQGRLEDAQKTVETAQKNLDEANSLSPEIIATFDGFITAVNVEGGDEVFKGTVAVTLADPDKFEAEILVSEMDIFDVALGGDATVEVSALPILNLSANVTHISPTATIQSGVVNYKVKVEVQSPSANSANQSGWGQIPPTTAGIPALSALTEAVQLKEGLTVTVSIVIDERNDVLLVPYRAISRSGRETLVKVITNGVIETRSIKTGLSNGQYTEVTDGLSEGEQVVIAQTTTSTSNSQNIGHGGFFMP